MNMTKRRRTKRYQRLLLRAGAFLGGVIFLASGLGLAIWKTDLGTVRGISVEGTEVLSAEAITASLRDALATPLLGPLKGNLIVFPSSRIIEALREAFPRIETLSVSRDLFRKTIRVSVKEREIFAIFCVPKERSEKTGENQCVLIDRSGFAFADAPTTEGGLILTIIDRTASSVTLGENVVSEDVLQTIAVAWEKMRNDLRIDIHDVVLEGEVLRLETIEGWTAILDLRRDITTQLRSLKELLIKELPEDHRERISTIDLRTPGKIFYEEKP
jgi:hypothetical protein